MFVKEMIDETVNTMWPLLLIVSVVYVLMRIFTMIYRKEKFVFYKECMSIIFIWYVLSLFYIVSFQDASYGGSNYTPFKEIFRFELFTDGFNRNILGNILLFMPLGYYICYFIRQAKFVPVMVGSIVTSLTIELMQRYIGRTFDIDDIILNFVGGSIGLFIYLVLDVTGKKLPRFFTSELFLNIVMFLLVVLLVWLNLDHIRAFKI